MKKCLLILLVLPVFLTAQTPFPALGPVFKDDVIPRVDITMPTDSLAQMLVPGSEYHWHARFVFDNGQIKDTVENIGIKIKGNTSIWANKKSFRISFNTYEEGRKWQGLEKLNLNGNHNDPLSARAKISCDLLRSMGVIGSRANHVKLYVNGIYYGLYINVEHVDEQFVKLRYGSDEGNLYKCLWPADLVFKGNNPNLYKEELGGRRAYELVTNTSLDDYSDLAQFIAVLNNTPIADLPCELEKLFNVDAYLKTLAFDVLDGNWDGYAYNKNNFYLYHNPVTDKFEYIPYDLDNTLGIDWLGVDWITQNVYSWAPTNQARPLVQRLMAVPAYKKRFTQYMRSFLQTVFTTESLFPYLDSLKALIRPALQADSYYPQDYGFDMDDFDNAWFTELPFNHTPVGLKPYIQGRRSSALQQLNNSDANPTIQRTAHDYLPPANGINFSAAASDDYQMGAVQVCYRWGGQDPVTCLALLDDGLNGDGAASDGIYGVYLDLAGQSGLMEYYTEATDNLGQKGRLPACGWRVIYVGAEARPLVINEFMASNSGYYPDAAGEYEDWVELYHPGPWPFSIKTFYLTDDMAVPGKWRLPDSLMVKDSYRVFWADSDETQGQMHTNFKLSAEGEHLALFRKNGDAFSLCDQYAFSDVQPGQAIGRLPNGTGAFQPVQPTPGAINQPPTAVQEAASDEQVLLVFPNPATNRISVKLMKENEAIEEMALMDANGRQHLHWKGSGRKTLELAIEPVLSGMYFLKITTSSGHAIWQRVLVL
ncbi:MAG: CotH kinase family protein [Saprospiraceae bacterium]|nr:CotH kinase family protein [Saprospiraceae bacterium]